MYSNVFERIASWTLSSSLALEITATTSPPYICDFGISTSSLTLSSLDVDDIIKQIKESCKSFGELETLPIFKLSWISNPLKVSGVPD
jgi:hypothetical protein